MTMDAQPGCFLDELAKHRQAGEAWLEANGFKNDPPGSAFWRRGAMVCGHAGDRWHAYVEWQGRTVGAATEMTPEDAVRVAAERGQFAIGAVIEAIQAGRRPA